MGGHGSVYVRVRISYFAFLWYEIYGINAIIPA